MSDFQNIQHQLANVIRDPSQQHNFEPRRIAVYQSLIFNNLESFCSTAFPVFKSLLSEEEWQSLIRNFLIEHPNASPYFVDIAEQFLTYLTTLPLPDDRPWQNELAHYEWVELHVSMQELANLPEQEYSVSELGNKKAQVAESAWALAYNFPVHKISKETVKELNPEPTFLIVFLERSGDVTFLQTSALTIHFLNLIEQHESLTAVELKTLFTKEPFQLSAAQAEVFVDSAFADLSEKGIVLFA